MKGVYKRCGCTTKHDNGKRVQLGSKCPKLRRADGSWNPKHGTWTFALSTKGKDGRRRQVVRGGYATRDEAAHARDQLKGKADKGVNVAERITVGAWLDRWLASKNDIKASTRTYYDQHIRTYLRPHLGRLWLDTLRVDHVQEMFAELELGAATAQRVRGTLRAALNDAMRQQLLTVNVASLVKLPSGKRPKALVWTEERVQRWQETGERPSPVMVWTAAQTGAFLDAASEDRLYALYHLIAFRGLRRGEACGLMWEYVDLDGGTLTVARQRVQVGWEVHEDSPKSDAGGRTIALDDDTVRALKAHRKTQLKERMAWGEAYQDTGLVFTWEDGSPLHPAYISDRFHEIRKAAGLPPIRLHDLRHGAASLMLAGGVDMKTVQETLGHSSITLTSDTYTSVYPEASKDAAEKAAAMVPRTKGA